MSRIKLLTTPCRRCGETGREHAGRGLCRRCHGLCQRDGTLGDYPRTRNLRHVSARHHTPMTDPCLRCGKTDLPHAGRGLCTTCSKRCSNDGTLLDYPRLTRSKEDTAEDVLYLTGCGETPKAVTIRLGMSPGAIAKALIRTDHAEQARPFWALDRASRRKTRKWADRPDRDRQNARRRERRRTAA